MIMLNVNNIKSNIQTPSIQVEVKSVKSNLEILKKQFPEILNNKDYKIINICVNSINDVDNLQTRQTIQKAKTFIEKFQNPGKENIQNAPVGLQNTPRVSRTTERTAPSITKKEFDNLKTSFVRQYPVFKDERIEELLDLLILVQYGLQTRPGDKDLQGCMDDILNAVQGNNVPSKEEILECQNIVSDILELKQISGQQVIAKKNTSNQKLAPQTVQSSEITPTPSTRPSRSPSPKREKALEIQTPIEQPKPQKKSILASIFSFIASLFRTLFA